MSHSWRRAFLDVLCVAKCYTAAPAVGDTDGLSVPAGQWWQVRCAMFVKGLYSRQERERKRPRRFFPDSGAETLRLSGTVGMKIFFVGQNPVGRNVVLGGTKVDD